MGFCFQLVDELGHHFRIQRLWFVDIVPLIEASDELVTSDGKGVRGGIGDRNPTNFEVIEFDQGRTSLQVAKSSGHDGDHMCCRWTDVPGVLGRDGGCGERTYGSLSSGDMLVFHVRNGKNLLSLGVVGHAEGVSQVDAQNVVVQTFTDQEGAQSLSIFVGGWKGIGPIEFEVVVAGPNDVRSVIGSLSMREVLLESLQGQAGSSRPRIV